MQKRRILIVDNNDELRAILENALGELGHEAVNGKNSWIFRVQSGTDGAEATTSQVASDGLKTAGAWAMLTGTYDATTKTIKLYVDDELLNETDLKQTVNGDSQAANPFHEPHSMLLNLAIGGTRGGDPAETEFPARLEVDYVRVFQRPTE